MNQTTRPLSAVGATGVVDETTEPSDVGVTVGGGTIGTRTP